MDNSNARKQAVAVAAQQQAQAVTVNDVVTMTKSGVNEELILNHIRSHGVAQPVQAGELVAMQQEGVSTRVIAAMQTAGVPGPTPAAGCGPVLLPAATASLLGLSRSWLRRLGSVRARGRLQTVQRLGQGASLR